MLPTHTDPNLTPALRASRYVVTLQGWNHTTDQYETLDVVLEVYNYAGLCSFGQTVAAWYDDAECFADARIIRAVPASERT